MLQDFFNTNQFKGKQTLNEYFDYIPDSANTISRPDQKLIPDLEETGRNLLKASMA